MVWSVELGGFGPGYEQAIQIFMMECLRWLVENSVSGVTYAEHIDFYMKGLQKDKRIKAIASDLQLSDAQYTAARNFAWVLFSENGGPWRVLSDKRYENRLIQISDNIVFKFQKAYTA